VSLAPVSADVDKLAGEVRSFVKAQSGDVDIFFVVVLDHLGHPAQRVSDQHEPVDCRQSYEQLAGWCSSKLGSRDENTNRERVADEANWDDDGQGAEVHVDAEVFDPDCRIRRRRGREPGRRRSMLSRRRRRVIRIHQLAQNVQTGNITRH